MDNPKIGTIDANGNPQFPTQTLSGQLIDSDDRATLTGHIHMLSSTTFCIGDVFVPKGFDVQAAIDALKAEIAAPASAEAVKSAKKPAPPDLPLAQA